MFITYATIVLKGFKYVNTLDRLNYIVVIVDFATHIWLCAVIAVHATFSVRPTITITVICVIRCISLLRVHKLIVMDVSN